MLKITFKFYNSLVKLSYLVAHIETSDIAWIRQIHVYTYHCKIFSFPSASSGLSHFMDGKFRIGDVMKYCTFTIWDIKSLRFYSKNYLDP